MLSVDVIDVQVYNGTWGQDNVVDTIRIIRIVAWIVWRGDYTGWTVVWIVVADERTGRCSRNECRCNVMRLNTKICEYEEMHVSNKECDARSSSSKLEHPRNSG